MRVDGMIAKVKGAKEAEGIKLVLCPEESAACYHKDVPPKHDDTIEVSGLDKRAI